MNKFIVTIHRKDQVLTREVNKDSFTMGRSLDCDISLNDSNISRVHLVVSRRWNQIWVEDKNSSNGTYINGTKIVQGTPVNVVAADRLQLGRSEYILNIDLEVEEALPEPEPEVAAEAEEEPPLEKTLAMPAPNMAPFQAEKILHDAKRKAAQIILEGETQAEKRVQAIYQKAREAQAQADIFYQTRMAEAHKEADAILADFQKQGQELLHEARAMAQELREEVDSYVQGLRQKARRDVEELISEATLTSEKMKDEALAQGRDFAKKESEELLRVTREEADRVLDFAKMKAEEVQARVQQEIADMEAESQLVAAALADKRHELEKMGRNLAELEEQNKTASDTLASTEQRAASVNAEVLKAQEELTSLQLQHKSVEELKKNLEASLKGLQEKQALLSMDIHDLESKKDHLFKEYDAQKIFLNEKLEKEKSQIAKSEEERLEEMRLETAKRLQKMERDLLDEVIRKKASMVKEIHAAIEKEVVLLMEPEKWRNISQSVENHIAEAIEGKVASLAQSSVADKPVNLMRKRKNEKMRWIGMGLAMGAVGYFVSQIVVDKVSGDQTPMQTMVSNEAKKRQEDLEKRRFNPPQADEIKSSYTDAVIYTRNYLDIYTDAQFQQKLYKAASQYLLKTWRLDEDKSIQVISSANALVKELAEKKSKIHPDFIKEGIEKMRDLEAQSLTRMKGILGTEVRLESYLKFERNFYMEEVQRRRMAQH